MNGIGEGTAWCCLDSALSFAISLDQTFHVQGVRHMLRISAYLSSFLIYHSDFSKIDSLLHMHGSKVIAVCILNIHGHLKPYSEEQYYFTVSKFMLSKYGIKPKHLMFVQVPV